MLNKKNLYNKLLLASGRFPGAFAVLLFSFVLTSALYAQDNQATQIVRLSNEKIEGHTLFSEIRMEVIRPRWQNEIKLKVWTSGHERALVLITSPPKDKGQSFLKRDADLWNWLPGIDRTVKMSSTLLSQSWMGSDFSNEDIINKSSLLLDYHHKLLGKENVRGQECYIIELKPLDDAPVVWGKIHLWITTNEYVQLKACFFNEYDRLIRTMNAFDLKSFAGNLLPSRIEMQPEDKPLQKTIMLVDNYDFNINIKDSFFSLQNMKTVR